jgi:hypothetical protein
MSLVLNDGNNGVCLAKYELQMKNMATGTYLSSEIGGLSGLQMAFDPVKKLFQFYCD